MTLIDRWNQIARGRHRPVLVIGCAAALGLAVFMLSGPARTQQQDAPPPPVPVEVAIAERRDVGHEIEAVGTVEALQDVVVRAQVDGILTRVHFAEGDFVQRGQLLATIDDRAQRAALAAAEAQLARDTAQLRAAELDLARYLAQLMPPLAKIFCPLIQALSPEQRPAMTPAMSSG